jgi:hypothetical protein
MMNKREFNGIFSEKVGYDSANKMFLVRVYPSLIRVFNTNPKPRWIDVVKDMLGSNSSVNPNGYYSSIRRCLKEIGVCTYDRNLGYFVKGSNWDRFFSDEQWNWFQCRTGSGERSFVTSSNPIRF